MASKKKPVCERCRAEVDAVHDTGRGKLCVSCLSELAVAYLEEDDITYESGKALDKRAK
jgi:hypothetical protein